MLADRRNSPCSGRPSTSSAHGLHQVAPRHRGDRAGHLAWSATAGRRSDVLTELLHLAPGAAGEAEFDALAGLAPRGRRLADPRAVGSAIRSLAATISLKASAILPSRPSLVARASVPRSRHRASACRALQQVVRGIEAFVRWLAAACLSTGTRRRTEIGHEISPTRWPRIQGLGAASVVIRMIALDVFKRENVKTAICDANRVR
jgi:hypothetical protein